VFYDQTTIPEGYQTVLLGFVHSKQSVGHQLRDEELLELLCEVHNIPYEKWEEPYEDYLHEFGTRNKALLAVVPKIVEAYLEGGHSESSTESSQSSSQSSSSATEEEYQVFCGRIWKWSDESAYLGEGIDSYYEAREVRVDALGENWTSSCETDEHGRFAIVVPKDKWFTLGAYNHATGEKPYYAKYVLRTGDKERNFRGTDGDDCMWIEDEYGPKKNGLDLLEK
jgi:hypothetical protein